MRLPKNIEAEGISVAVSRQDRAKASGKNVPKIYILFNDAYEIAIARSRYIGQIVLLARTGDPISRGAHE